MIAQGYQRNGPNGLRRITISMDDETFQQVRKLAERERCSFAEEARVLIEFGLEAANAN